MAGVCAPIPDTAMQAVCCKLSGSVLTLVAFADLQRYLPARLPTPDLKVAIARLDSNRGLFRPI
jgi:hypothetical protein